MADVKEAWSEVATRFGELSEKLKEHFSHPPEPETAEGAAGIEAAEAGTGARRPDASAADALKDALRNLGDALNTTVEAVSAAVKDPDVTQQARQVGQAFVNALSSTFADAGEEIRKAFNRSKQEEQSDTPPDEPALDRPESD